MARAHATTDHQAIRRWIETHNGHPSVVRATQGRRKDSVGLLRVDFGTPEESLEEISWDDFFDTFEQNNLAFLYQDEKDSRFHKFVNRDSVDEDMDESSARESSTARSSKSSGSLARPKSDGGARQASPAEEEEAVEIDEEDVEEEDEDFDDEIADDEEDEDEEDEEPRRGGKKR